MSEQEMSNIETFGEFCKNNSCSNCRLKKIATITGCFDCEKHFMKEHDDEIKGQIIREVLETVKEQNEIYLAEREKQIRADAIDEYKRKLIEDVSQRAQANERVYSVDDANLFNYATRTFIDALNYFAEQLKENNNG